MSEIINLNNIDKYYILKHEKLHVLKSIDINIESGDFIMIMGKSGSGKTTLLNVLSLMDSFQGGTYLFNGRNVTGLNENEKSHIRNKYMGFIFQQFFLIESLNISQNIALPMLYGKVTNKVKMNSKIKKYISVLGLQGKNNVYPNELSGGQQQRVSIARALINDPLIIFADEPTGALDSETSREIMDILKNLNNEGRTIIMVTHDEELTKYSNKVLSIIDGKIYYQR